MVSPMLKRHNLLFYKHIKELLFPRTLTTMHEKKYLKWKFLKTFSYLFLIKFLSSSSGCAPSIYWREGSKMG